MEKDEITIELLYRKLENSLTEEEDKRFQEWIQNTEHQRYYRNLKSFYELKEVRKPESEEINDAWGDLQKRINHHKPKFGSNRILWGSVVAASIVILLGITPYLWTKEAKNTSLEMDIQIRPGQPNAILELAHGKTYRLEELIGQKAGELGAHIIVDSCQLSYLKNDTLTGRVAEYNTLTIPRGGEFQLRLEDGTKVWLNAESRLKYPQFFSGEKREVYLEGEAYFEVAKDARHPFVVYAGIQEVTVLGTSFGITGYANETSVSTTLVSGQVKVRFPTLSAETYFLEPGYQVVGDAQNRQIEKRRVDVDEFVAWHEGKYVFAKKRLEDILSTLSRWYDFEVFYQNPEAKEVLFTGELKRFDNFNDLLHLIGKTSDVKFDVDKNIVVVRKL